VRAPPRARSVRQSPTGLLQAVGRQPKDLSLWPAVGGGGSNSQMIVSDSVRIDVGFDVARARLARLTQESTLLAASRHAYGQGQAVVRVGPMGNAPVLSKLVEVRFRDLVTHGDAAVLTLRWEASGASGGLFPALDADITLSPVSEDACALRLDGAYRPPLGGIGAGLDRALLHRVAMATIADFIGRIADAIIHPALSAAPSPDLAGSTEAAGRPIRSQLGSHST
jgi:hypothetical protein